MELLTQCKKDLANNGRYQNKQHYRVYEIIGLYFFAQRWSSRVHTKFFLSLDKTRAILFVKNIMLVYNAIQFEVLKSQFPFGRVFSKKQVNSKSGKLSSIQISGIAWYQEKDKSKQVIAQGDVVVCAPGAMHWHGATPHAPMTHTVATGRGDPGSSFSSYPIL